MEKITELLKKKDFTISVELIPPRNGEQVDKFFSNASELKGHVDFVSVTKGAGGSLRGGTLPISYFIKNKLGINPIAHFVCRERTKAEVENDLVDLHYFGINNILALRGDAPAGAKDEPWSGDYNFACELAEHISKLNKGKYLPRKGFDVEWRNGEMADFCILAAGHPENPIDQEIAHLKAKIDSGAEVIITQMIFSFQAYKDYIGSLRKNGINVPVIPGIRPLTHLKQAESIEEFFGLRVDDAVKEILRDGDAKNKGLGYFAQMVMELRKYGAPGVHLFVLNDAECALELIKLASKV